MSDKFGDHTADEFADLASIVRDIAEDDCQTWVTSNQVACVFCDARPPALQLTDHAERCPYRRAVEWRKRHEGHE